MLDRGAAVGTSLKFSLAPAQPRSRETLENGSADAMWTGLSCIANTADREGCNMTTNDCQRTHKEIFLDDHARPTKDGHGGRWLFH